MAERTGRERETLIFENPDTASEFVERVEKRIQREHVKNPDRQREIVAEEVTKEFEHEGEGVGNVRGPWEHTEDEHHETQQLVNIAFQDDIRSAIKRAQQGNHYPRNIDLMHDVITTEMYELISQTQLNKQDALPWLLGTLSIIVVALVASLVLFVI